MDRRPAGPRGEGGPADFGRESTERATPLRKRLLRLLEAGGEDSGLVAAAPVLPVREIFRRFWPYARPYRLWLLAGIALAAVGPAIAAVEIWLFKLVVDDVLVPGDFGPFVPLAAAFVGLTLIGGVVSFCDELLATWVGERFLLGLRTSCFRHLQGLSLDFFERRRLGDTLARLTSDVSAIESFVLSGVGDVVSYTLRIVIFTGALFLLDPLLALVSLVVAPLFWLTARYFSRRIKDASREKRRRAGSVAAVAEESLANAQLVQAYNRQETEIDRFERENLAGYRAQMASTRLKALFTPVIDLIDLTGALIVMGVGTWQLTQGRLTLGGLLAFLAYLSQLYSPIRGLAKLSNTIYSASAGAERISELLEERPAVEEKANAYRLGRARGSIEFEQVSFAYPGSDHDALGNVSFRVEPGETLALVGASGAGKSTATKLLLRFYDPTAGRILVDGHDLRDLDLESLRASIGLLLQETLVFDGSVRENVAYGNPHATERELDAAVAAADAAAFIAALPEGYETRLGQRGRRLSGGQRQRIAIARALIRDAPVLVLDEPATGVDAESHRRIAGLLRDLMRDRTTIVISHSLLTVRDATSILLLEHGRVVARGTHDELVAASSRYARLADLHELDRPSVEAV